MEIDDIADAIVRILKDYDIGRLSSKLVDEEFKIDTGLVLWEEIKKGGGYDSLDISLRSNRRRACCTRSDNGDMEYHFLSSRSQVLSEPPAQLPYNCGSLEQNSTAIRDNELHVESQIKIQLGHEHPESGALDHCSTIKQDASNDQEKHQECPSQNQEEQGKSVDSPQDTLPSVRLEGTGDGANTLMGETMRTGKASNGAVIGDKNKPGCNVLDQSAALSFKDEEPMTGQQAAPTGASGNINSVGNMAAAGHAGRGRGRTLTLPAWKTRENASVMNSSEPTPPSWGKKEQQQLRHQPQHDEQPLENRQQTKPSKALHTSNVRDWDGNNNSYTNNTNTSVKAEHSNAIDSSEAAPLRSRGRGVGATLPAWMTSREGGPTSLPHDKLTPQPRNRSSGRRSPDGPSMGRRDLGMTRLLVEEKTEQLQRRTANISLRVPRRTTRTIFPSAVPNDQVASVTSRSLKKPDPPIIVNLTELQQKLLLTTEDTANKLELPTIFTDIDNVENSNTATSSSEHCESWTMLGAIEKRIPVYLNTSEPFCAVIVGEEGAGNDRTVGCLTEGCVLSTQSERMLLRDEKVLRLDSPKTTVILHYDQNPLSYPEICSLVVKNGSVPGVEPLNNMKIKVFVSSISLQQKKDMYGGIQGLDVSHLLFEDTQLNTDEQSFDILPSQLDLLTGFDGNTTNDQLDIDIQRNQSHAKLMDQYSGPHLRQGYQLDMVMLTWYFCCKRSTETEIFFHQQVQGKDVVIIDLADSRITPMEANRIFAVVLSQLQNKVPSFSSNKNKLIILNEAQNYMMCRKHWGPLENVLLDIVRHKHKTGTSTVISTQVDITISRQWYVAKVHHIYKRLIQATAALEEVFQILFQLRHHLIELDHLNSAKEFYLPERFTYETGSLEMGNSKNLREIPLLQSHHEGER